MTTPVKIQNPRCLPSVNIMSDSPARRMQSFRLHQTKPPSNLHHKSKMDPDISIIMPVYNGEKYLAAAIDSLLAQTFKDFELLVIDDGSTDHTPEILRSYADIRLRVLRLDHVGIVFALNHGLSQAKAEWVARLDADDLSLPRRLELQVQAVKQWQAVNRHHKPFFATTMAACEASREAVLCHTNVTFLNEDNQPIGVARLPRSRSFTALRLCYQCPIVHSTVMFKKSAVLAAGGYLLEERHAEDFSLWGRMLEQGEFVALPQKLVQLRIHQQSVSKKNLDIQRALTRQIGIRHCQKFMGLSEAEAARANTILLTAPRDRSWRDWCWFLTHGLLQLRWKSTETIGWFLWQTIKLVLRR
jgi:glycosyltransferase involved in cell wall biosynthesis